MKCVITALVLGGLFVNLSISFNADVNKSLEYTSLENIVKRGIQRLCDRQSINVLNKCKRPLVRVSGSESEFDLHTKVSRTISEVLNLKVEEVNDKLSNEIKKDLSIIGSCKLYNDGLNINLKDEYLMDQLDSMLSDERLSVGKLTNEKVVVDYFSPNVGKMLHMGHIRSLAIGQSLSNLLEFSGSKVYRRNHVGDFGLQSGIIMRYLMEYDVNTFEILDPDKCDKEREIIFARKVRGYTVSPYTHKIRYKRLHLPVSLFGDQLIVATIDSYYKLASEKFKNDPEFEKRAKIETNLLQKDKSFAQVQWERIKDVTLEHYNDLLDFYYIEGLKHIPESTYKNVAEEFIKKIVEEGKAKKKEETVVYELEGETEEKTKEKENKSEDQSQKALELKQSDQGNSLNDGEGENNVNPENEGLTDSQKEPSLNKSVLRTREGSLTYMATDLAALSHRVNWNKPNRIIYVTEKNQKPHFQKMYKISKKLKILKDCKLEHVGFGQVKLEGEGKMRSRSGKNCSLIDITNEVVNLVDSEMLKRGEYLDEVRSVLSRRIGVGSLLFSDLSVEPSAGYNFSIERLMNQGNKGLIAILYSYARSHSILKKAEELNKVETREFRNNFERRLGRTLVGFENMVLTALSRREPHRVCKYLLNLAKEFNQFYQTTPVIVDGSVHSQSLKLVVLTSRAIELGLKFLNIKPVKKL